MPPSGDHFGLMLLDEGLLRAHLDRLSENFETQLAPKPVWKASKMTPEVLARLMRQISSGMGSDAKRPSLSS